MEDHEGALEPVVRGLCTDLQRGLFIVAVPKLDHLVDDVLVRSLVDVRVSSLACGA